MSRRAPRRRARSTSRPRLRLRAGAVQSSLLAALLSALAGASPAAEKLLPPDLRVSVGRTVAFDGFVDENDRPFAAVVNDPAVRADPRPWIASPIYTRCPHTCGPLTAALRKALRESGLQASDYRVFSFSFDPQETAEGLAGFRTMQNLPPDWPTLRATNAAALARALEALDFRTITVADGMIEHPNLVAILAPDLRLVTYVYGVNFSPAELAAAVARARRGPSRLDAWRPYLFAAAALGFLISAFVFTSLLTKRRAPLGVS